MGDQGAGKPAPFSRQGLEKEDSEDDEEAEETEDLATGSAAPSAATAATADPAKWVGTPLRGVRGRLGEPALPKPDFR